MATLGEIADLLQCDAPPHAARTIAAVAPLDQAGPEDLSFLANPRYRAQLAATRAAAVLVRPKDQAHVPDGTVPLVVDDPYAAMAAVLRHLHPVPPPVPGVHSTAFVDPAAAVDATAAIGPHAVVAAGATVGPRTRVGAHCTIGEGSHVGADGLLHAHVTIYAGCSVGDRAVLHAGVVIGSDGFGFAPTARGLAKVPQVGGVTIGDDVELGANTTIDRGTLGDTVLANGVKLDNMVQVAHNVRIGAHTVVAAQTGIAGSATIGAGCMIGGQVGIAGHIAIGDGCMVAAKTGIMRDLAAGSRVAGVPARPHRRWLREIAILERMAQHKDDETP